MRLEALFAALVLFGDLAGPAHADLRGQPQFSAAESQTIARNELLNAVVGTLADVSAPPRTAKNISAPIRLLLF